MVAGSSTPQEAVMNHPAVGTPISPGSPTTGRSPARLPNSSGPTPAAADDAGNGLISHVQAKRAEVEQYLRAVRARRHRLVTVTIVAAAIATLLTSWAAVGGKRLVRELNDTLELSSASAFQSWQILCLLAAVCSLVAAVATQLHTSKNYEEHITRAQESKATLEMLEAAIALNHLNQQEATSQYLKVIENTSFIEPARVARWD
jgi:hypothetical protein